MRGLTFTCDYQRLKRLSLEFYRAAQDETNIDALEAGFACLALHYIGMVDCAAHEETGAVIIMRLAMQSFTKAEKRILGI